MRTSPRMETEGPRGLHHAGQGLLLAREEGSPGLGFGFGLAGAAGGQQSEDQIKNQVNQG